MAFLYVTIVHVIRTLVQLSGSCVLFMPQLVHTAAHTGNTGQSSRNKQHRPVTLKNTPVSLTSLPPLLLLELGPIYPEIGLSDVPGVRPPGLHRVCLSAGVSALEHPPLSWQSSPGPLIHEYMNTTSGR